MEVLGMGAAWLVCVIRRDWKRRMKRGVDVGMERHW